jgi:hypothetical protein
MSPFAQGFVLGGVFGVFCGVAAMVLMIVPILRAGKREEIERKRRARHALSRIKNAVPIACMSWIVLSGCGTTTVTKVEVRERIDTLLVKGDTIRILDVRSDTLYVDTVAANDQRSMANGQWFRSVRAALDTTVQGVRLYLQYAYPQDRWRADIIQRDTVIKWTVRDSIVQRPYEVEHVPLWVYIAIGGMALALIAVLIKR